MIKKMDVIRMYIPIPNINSALARNSHMYVCMEHGLDKEFIKCQTFKPTHLLDSTLPKNYIVENPDSTRNPFNNTTTIDCDKSFCISNVTVQLGLLTTIRRGVNPDLFSMINNKAQHTEFNQVRLDVNDIVSLNSQISHL